MVTKNQIELALHMWNSGSTHGEIKKQTKLTHEQEFAITEVGIIDLEILNKTKKSMTSKEIKALL